MQKGKKTKKKEHKKFSTNFLCTKMLIKKFFLQEMQKKSTQRFTTKLSFTSTLLKKVNEKYILVC